jgi:crotonobetainyl-CoA:carnitine CoA-transferase CaiB-like acyl-CoA transferase
MSYRLPLDGIRILDLTMAWAGPYATRLLADMGAEVVKIESARNWDLLRALHFLGRDTERWYDKSAYFNHLNRNKLGCALDLSTPGSRELFLALVSKSDVVIENLRPGALEDLGLTYGTLCSARPDVILVSMPAHGGGGPESHRIAYGTNVEQVAGLTSVTGYVGGEPHKSGISYGDPVAGIAAAGAVGAALLYRRRTGRGQYVELAQRETMTSLIGEFVVGYGMNGRQPPFLGNRHRSMAPHGVYPCAGDDQWLALAVGSDEEFAGLCRAIERPELAADARFADVVSRYRHQDDLDEIIGAWTRERTPAEAAERLQGEEVAASPVLSIAQLMADRHLRARGFFETVSHAEAGVWDVDGVAWRFSGTPGHVRLPAPCFAEHNGYVFGELLGLSAAEIESLEAEGVIGNEPLLSLHD